MYASKNFKSKKAFKDAIVNGERFSIAPDQPKGYGGFVGHGGAEFTIRFADGRGVVTHNLWHQGKIPDRFRARFPGNVKFVKGKGVSPR